LTDSLLLMSMGVDGREIENYFDPDAVEEAVRHTHKLAEAIEDKSEFANVLRFKRKEPRASDGAQSAIADKIRVARELVESEADLSRLDLKDRVRDIVDFIRASNALE
jgi:hypothetical protein